MAEEPAVRGIGVSELQIGDLQDQHWVACDLLVRTLLAAGGAEAAADNGVIGEFPPQEGFVNQADRSGIVVLVEGQVVGFIFLGHLDASGIHRYVICVAFNPLLTDDAIAATIYHLFGADENRTVRASTALMRIMMPENVPAWVQRVEITFSLGALPLPGTKAAEA